MKRSRPGRILALLLALVLVAAACSQRDEKTSTGGGGGGGGGGGEGSAEGIDTADCGVDPTTEVEGDTIKLASSFPQSGLTAAFSQIYNGWKAYFEYVNEEEGGVEINGKSYKIETEDKDDEYNAAKTSANIEELVGDGTEAFATFSVVGTANNIAIRDFLGDLCVPNLFAATGSPAWGNPEYPWTIGSTLSPYSLEGQAFASYLKEEKPDAKVAMLVQDDDFGEAYEQSFKDAIEGTDITVTKVERYSTGASEVGSQITSLAASGADAFFNGATLLACPNALTQAKQADFDVITWISATCASKTLTGIAGPAADKAITYTNLKDPLNPKWDDDEAMQLYRDKVEQYSPDPKVDIDNGIVAYGWTQAALLVHAMENAEAATRLDVMNAVRNLDGVSDVGLLLPDVAITTAPPEDQYMGETAQLIQFDAEKMYFEYVGGLKDYEGKTPELTPEDLISG
jgi:branched-chain amino acid transport system substrate-binding protein